MQMAEDSYEITRITIHGTHFVSDVYEIPQEFVVQLETDQ